MRSTRWHVNDNLLGSRRFCLIVLKTATLRELLDVDVRSRLSSVKDSVDPALFKRAVDYLYFKETRSSFDIERETSAADREQKFVRALHDAWQLQHRTNTLGNRTDCPAESDRRATLCQRALSRLAKLRPRIYAQLAMRGIVDMPNKRLDLLIKLLHLNGGRISRSKRTEFAELADDEIARMEAAYQDGLSDTALSHDDFGARP